MISEQNRDGSVERAYIVDVKRWLKTIEGAQSSQCERSGAWGFAENGASGRACLSAVARDARRRARLRASACVLACACVRVHVCVCM
eukprot:1706648-Pleurochrysis_carterae.AAC.1